MLSIDDQFVSLWTETREIRHPLGPDEQIQLVNDFFEVFEIHARAELKIQDSERFSFLFLLYDDQGHVGVGRSFVTGQDFSALKWFSGINFEPFAGRGEFLKEEGKDEALHIGDHQIANFFKKRMDPYKQSKMAQMFFYEYGIPASISCEQNQDGSFNFLLVVINPEGTPVIQAHAENMPGDYSPFDLIGQFDLRAFEGINEKMEIPDRFLEGNMMA